MLGQRLAAGAVDAGQRFVEEQDLGPTGQRPGHQRPPLLAARQGGDRCTRAVGETDGGDGVVHGTPVGPPHPPPQAGAGQSTRGDDLPHGRRDRARRLLALRHVADPTAVLQLAAEQLHLAAEPFTQTEDALDERRLARTVRAEQRHDLAAPHDQVCLHRHLSPVAEPTLRHPDDGLARRDMELAPLAHWQPRPARRLARLVRMALK